METSASAIYCIFPHVPPTKRIHLEGDFDFMLLGTTNIRKWARRGVYPKGKKVALRGHTYVTLSAFHVNVRKALPVRKLLRLMGFPNSGEISFIHKFFPVI